MEATFLSGKQAWRDSGAALSPWCFCRLKRSMDLLVALILVLIAFPAMAIIALLVRATSPGPVLFRQKRLGKGGEVFELLKFRTMHHARPKAGSGLTRRGDQRITGIGRVLRRCKLDELPQLFNVLQGEMSLVGPRPDLPCYFESLTPEQRRVLSLVPGITGPASLKFRNEEELLAQIAPQELESFYVKTLLPHKIALELEYARKASIVGDTVMLFRTAAAVLR